MGERAKVAVGNGSIDGRLVAGSAGGAAAVAGAKAAGGIVDVASAKAPVKLHAIPRQGINTRVIQKCL